MSKLEVDAIEPQSGTTLTIGASGDSVNIASGATITDFTSTGIDDNATSTAITIDSSENVGIGTTSPASLGANITTLEMTGGSTIRQGGIYLSNSDKSVKSYFYGTNALTVLATESNIPLAFSTNNTERMRINTFGSVTNPHQPAFLAYVSPSVQNNITGGDTIIFNNESFDQQGDFSSNTFTAPVTGKYQFDFIVSVSQLDYNATLNRIQMVTSNKTYLFNITSAQMFTADPTYFSLQGSLLVDMDSGDTCKLMWSQAGGTNSADVFDSTYFSGYLVC